MLKNITNREPKTFTEYHLVYDDQKGNGCWFPCDKDGNLEGMTEAALKNLENCKAHPEKFARSGEVVATERTYIEPAHGTCDCGKEVVLENQYYGSCQCPKCGRWYNLFAQEILPPDKWGDDLEEDY